VKLRIVVLGALLALAGALSPGAASADGTVGVELSEFAIAADASTVEAGAVTFNIDNVGSFGHELIVIRTDLAPDALPTAGEGQADEAQLDVVAEARPPFDGGTSQTLTANLTAGNYLLVCNVFNDAFPPGHYGRGMVTSLTVTAAAASPAPPAAGSAGLVPGGGGSTLLIAGLLLAATVVLLGGARAVARSRSS
jgi:uncharacterized cupredoxin-like copper-binding protein